MASLLLRVALGFYDPLHTRTTNGIIHRTLTMGSTLLFDSMLLDFLMTLTGTDGSGKTRLALEVGRQCAEISLCALLP